MRTKIFSLLLVVAMLMTTAAFSETEEEIPGASKHKLKVKAGGRVQVRWEADLNKHKQELEDNGGTHAGTGSNFSARRVRLVGKAAYGKVVKANVTANASNGTFSVKYAWMGFKIAGPVWGYVGLQNYGLDAFAASSGKFMFGDSNRGFSRVVENTHMGAALVAGLMKKKLIIKLALVNAGEFVGKGGTTDSTAGGGYQHYAVAGSFLFSAFKPWKLGKEWLNPKGMKLMFNLAYAWAPSTPIGYTSGTNVKSLNSYKGLVNLKLQMGFKFNRIVFRTGMDWAHAGYLGTDGQKYHVAPHFAWLADFAFHVNKNIIPAVRLEQYFNGLVARDTNNGNNQRRQITRLHFVVNIHPYGLGHGVKLQPEILAELQDADNRADTGTTRDSRDKDIKFRLTGTLNF